MIRFSALLPISAPFRISAPIPLRALISISAPINLRSLNHYHDYSYTFTLSNASELFLSRIPKNNIQVQKEKQNLAVACLRRS